MAQAHLITPVAPIARVTVARLGAGTSLAQRMSDVDAGKIVKLVGESRYDLTAAGEAIEGFVVSTENATSAGFTLKYMV